MAVFGDDDFKLCQQRESWKVEKGSFMGTSSFDEKLVILAKIWPLDKATLQNAPLKRTMASLAIRFMHLLTGDLYMHKTP